jgi:hypothetical protein
MRVCVCEREANPTKTFYCTKETLLDILAALGRSAGRRTQGIVSRDDHEGEDALRDDVHDGIGHNLNAESGKKSQRSSAASAFFPVVNLQALPQARGRITMSGNDCSRAVFRAHGSQW